MNTVSLPQEPIVLAIYPCAGGFGYALFESMYKAVDWRVKTTTKPDVHSVSMGHVKQLIDWFKPSVIVMQDCACSLIHCTQYVADLINSIGEYAAGENIAARQYTRKHIRECFSVQYGAVTKFEIASAITKVIPDLALRQPPTRKPWRNESYHMPIFDAASLVFTFYYFEFLRHEQTNG